MSGCGWMGSDSLTSTWFLGWLKYLELDRDDNCTTLMNILSATSKLYTLKWLISSHVNFVQKKKKKKKKPDKNKISDILSDQIQGHLVILLCSLLEIL